MKKEGCFIFLAFVLFGSINTQTLIADECTTPKNESGVCIQLMSCNTLLKILDHRIKTKSIEDYNFLKKSHCGFDGRAAKVCCPLEDTSPDSTEYEEVEIEDGASTGLLSQTSCGKSGKNHVKILGGNKVQLGYWPWLAALGYQYVSKNGDVRENPLQWLCGGTLITNRHVLTAAHCVRLNRSNAKLFSVRLGDLDLNPKIADGTEPLDVLIEHTSVHSKYNVSDLTNDIAILKLKNAVSFNKYIQPICLLSLSEMSNINLMETMPFVAGWGYPDQHDDLTSSFPLMEIQLPIVNTTACQQSFKNQQNVIDNRVICTGYPKGGKDSCRGDSGGPLMWPKKEQYFLMGIESYGSKICGSSNPPGVYTSVPKYIDWIEEKIREL